MTWKASIFYTVSTTAEGIAHIRDSGVGETEELVGEKGALS